MARFVWMAAVLQLVVVLAGHFLEAVLNLSGVLGTAIPFVVAVVYGFTTAETFRRALRGGALVGLVGALVGSLLAILLRDATWTLLTYAPVASTLTGCLGAVVGRAGSGPPTTS